MSGEFIVVGQPKDFDLHEQLKSAQKIEIANAFATIGGWGLIREAVVGSSAVVEIVVGLNGWITDSKLLQEWYVLSEKRFPSLSVRVAGREPVFHPKVLIATKSADERFAIVGSANLTHSGMRRNVECGAFVTGPTQLDELQEWFAGLSASRLDQKIIAAYTEECRALKKSKERTKLSGSSLDQMLKSSTSTKSPQIWNHAGFIEAFGTFLKSPDGRGHLENRIIGASRIRRALDFPRFQFGAEGWEEFYRIHEFGAVRLTHPGISGKIAKVRALFRLLTEPNLDSQTLHEAIETHGKHHITGIGTNLLTKVLTVSRRNYWPLFNTRVITAFQSFGYKADWGAENYFQFAHEMRTLLAHYGLLDFWALDAFCEVVTRV